MNKLNGTDGHLRIHAKQEISLETVKYVSSLPMLIKLELEGFNVIYILHYFLHDILLTLYFALHLAVSFAICWSRDQDVEVIRDCPRKNWWQSALEGK